VYTAQRSLRVIGFVMPRSLSLDAEEDEAVPPRAGDRAGDCRERAVRAALPFVAIGENGDGVLGASVLPDQPGARDGPGIMADATGGGPSALSRVS